MIVGYALAIKADNRKRDSIIVQMMSLFSDAHNEQEAEGVGLAYARQKWPISDGWHDHLCAVVEVRTEHLRQGAEKPPAPPRPEPNTTRIA